MRILVTGGAGFIGSWIADALADAGHEVYSIDDLSGGSLQNVSLKVKFMDVDLRSDLAPPIIKDISPEVVYHLCANAREGASFYQPLDAVTRNYLAFMNTLEVWA